MNCCAQCRSRTPTNSGTYERRRIRWAHLGSKVQVGDAREHGEQEDGEEGEDVVLGRPHRVAREAAIGRAGAQPHAPLPISRGPRGLLNGRPGVLLQTQLIRLMANLLGPSRTRRCPSTWGPVASSTAAQGSCCRKDSSGWW